MLTTLAATYEKWRLEVAVQRLNDGFKRTDSLDTDPM